VPALPDREPDEEEILAIDKAKATSPTARSPNTGSIRSSARAQNGELKLFRYNFTAPLEKQATCPVTTEPDAAVAAR
jgi:probable phosphoglycerate mutase